MRIKKYHVKGHAYAQLIDDNNFVHYIGPWNADTLCICYYHIGSSELFNRDKKIRKYFNNIYVTREKIVIRMPFLNKQKKQPSLNDTKYENFSLSNRIFIASY